MRAVNFCFTVIANIDKAPPCILGADLLRTFSGNIDYGENSGAPPSVTLNKPVKVLLQSYYIFDSQLSITIGSVNLNSGESQTIKTIFHPCSSISKGDKVLFDSQVHGDIEILPSYSLVYLDEEKNQLFSLVLAQNIGKHYVNKKLKIEFSNTPGKIIELNDNSINQLSQIKTLIPCHFYPDMDKRTQIHINTDNLPINEIIEEGSSLFQLKLREKGEDPKIHFKENDPEKEKLFKDPNDSINRNIIESSGDIDPDIVLPTGYKVLDSEFDLLPEEIVNLKNFKPIEQPYIKKIFIDKYSNILAKNSLDSGNISDTLGFYSIKLKPGAQLPSHRKIYFLCENSRKHLSDIIHFMLRQNLICKAPLSDNHCFRTFGAPAYLIPKNRPGASARLIIDFSKINNLLELDPSPIPNITGIFHRLRNFSVFTCLDLSNAYHSLTLSPETKHLTKFSTPIGQYYFNQLPQGLALSPNVWSRAIDKILNEKCLLDKKGNILRNSDGTAQMVPDVLEYCLSYFDDILIASKQLSTFEETIHEHFRRVEQVALRLSQHQTRISFGKSQFAKFAIKFLGHHIANNYICADPSRINKLMEAPFPETKKGIRSFLGLVNSLRSGLNREIMKDVYILTPLTSNSKTYEYSQSHIDAFNRLKIKLTSAPIYSAIICPNSPKFLFTDSSANEKAFYSATLCQLTGNPDKHYIPSYLNLESKIDQIIHYRKLNFRPIPIDLINKEQKEINRYLNTSNPPDIFYLNTDLLGYKETTVNNSLFTSVQNILLAYNCKSKEISELRNIAIQNIKKSELSLNLQTFTFRNDLTAYQRYIMDLRENQTQVDKDNYTLDALARGLFRQFIVISETANHNENHIKHYNSKIDTKPPFIFGLYERKGKIIFRPYIIDKNLNYELSKDHRKFEVILYHSRAIPPNMIKSHIFINEVFALLSSLDALKSYVKDSELTCVTDSKALYLLYHKVIQSSSVKLCRWSLKLACEYPRLKIIFTKSESNIADFLSKRFEINIHDVAKVGLPRFEINHIDDTIINKEFSLEEWSKWVDNNPQFLKILPEPEIKKEIKQLKNDNNINLNINYLNTMTKTIAKQTNIFKILDEKLKYSNLQQAQKHEFQLWIKKCITSKTSSFTTVEGLNVFTKFGLLYLKSLDGPKLIVPKSLQPILLTYGHLISAHGGVERLKATLDNYYFPQKNKLIKMITQQCFSCQLSNHNTQREIICSYPSPDYPLQTIHLDLAENLNNNSGFSHLLIAVCQLTDFTLIFPIKSKTTTAVTHCILYSIVQQFNVKFIMSDNAQCFNDKKLIKLLAVLGITKLRVSSLSPLSRGKIESRVKIVKMALKKFLVTDPTFQWKGLELIVSKILNSTVSTRTGMSPNDFIFNDKSLPFSTGIAKLHPLIKSESNSISEAHNLCKLKTEIVKQRIEKITKDRNERLNKNKRKSNFQKNDIVFAIDTKQIPGNPRPLKTKYHHSPLIVIDPLFSTTLVKRLSDGVEFLFHNSHLKLYKKLDNFFSDLDPAVLNIINNDDLNNISEKSLAIIQDKDPFTEHYSEESQKPLFIRDSKNPISQTNDKIENSQDTSESSSDDEENISEFPKISEVSDEILEDKSSQQNRNLPLNRTLSIIPEVEDEFHQDIPSNNESKDKISTQPKLPTNKFKLPWTSKRKKAPTNYKKMLNPNFKRT